MSLEGKQKSGWQFVPTCLRARLLLGGCHGLVKIHSPALAKLCGACPEALNRFGDRRLCFGSASGTCPLGECRQQGLGLPQHPQAPLTQHQTLTAFPKLSREGWVWDPVMGQL